MSTTLQADLMTVDLPVEHDDVYRSLSRSAVFGVVLAALGLFGMWFAPLIVLPLFGLIFSALGIYYLGKYPLELTGRPIAWIGVIVNASLLVGLPIYHAYVYATELPEGYERVSFSELKSPLGARDIPPESAMELDGKKVFLKGYAHPSSMSASSVKHFILVPDIATCCFGGQPPLTHMVEINLAGDKSVTPSMFKKLRLAGTLTVDPNLKPVTGLNGVYYQLQVDQVVD